MHFSILSLIISVLFGSFIDEQKEKANSVSIHYGNIQALENEIYK